MSFLKSLNCFCNQDEEKQDNKRRFDKIEADIQNVKENHLEHIKQQLIEIRTDLKLINMTLTNLLQKVN